MRIAVPIWNDKVSPVLDAATRLLIVDVEDKKETSRFEVHLNERDLLRRCFRIRDMEVDILICGAVSQPLLSMLTASDIDIITEIAGQTEDILTAYLKGGLFQPRFLMPGCKRNRYGANRAKPCRRQK